MYKVGLVDGLPSVLTSDQRGDGLPSVLTSDQRGDGLPDVLTSDQIADRLSFIKILCVCVCARKSDQN